MENSKIECVTLVTAVGIRAYRIGEDVNGKKIERIQIDPLYFTGDPFDHYCVYSGDDLIASINPLCPCTVDYI